MKTRNSNIEDEMIHSVFMPSDEEVDRLISQNTYINVTKPYRPNTMNDENSIGWGTTKIQYQIMTDSDGVQWRVPTHIDGKPVEYLQKHDPKAKNDTFINIDYTPKTP